MPKEFRRAYNVSRLLCPACGKECRNSSGLTQHYNSIHVLPAHHAATSSAPGDGSNNTHPHDAGSQANEGGGHSGDEANLGETFYHPQLNGRPCDSNGRYLPDGTPPLHRPPPDQDNWTPYRNRVEFETAEFLFKREQMSGPKINTLFDLWAASMVPFGGEPPFADQKDLYSTIDATLEGGTPWQNFSAFYTGARPAQDAPPWMSDSYDVWFRDPRAAVRSMLANPDYKEEFDAAPYREFTPEGERQYRDFMSGHWAWKQADIIAEDPNTHGSMFVPIILGSDKTTVSVATGQNEYYPLYMSIGNIHNNVRRAHREGLTVIGFLAIPKTERKHADTAQFRRFKRQLFHSSLAGILEALRPGMTTPEVSLCPDGHYRRVLYGLGPYIADYPEQTLVASIVLGWCPACLRHRDRLDQKPPDGDGRRTYEHAQEILTSLDPGVLWDEYGLVADIVPFTASFPRADIYELLAGDLLHQVIKGSFKDHLVTWVGEYLVLAHGKEGAKAVLDEIDRRIAAVPPFPGLRHFPQGRDFKQWTGDDSKALMKVYLPAISGLVPAEMVRAVSSFLEFCYLVRRAVHTEGTIGRVSAALTRFHKHREVFKETGVREDFSLPRHHSLDHYPRHIRNHGAPNGLCSSITEAKHIKAVKEPWRRSNRFNALGQMLITNQRLDKLAASRISFSARGMLQGTCLSAALLAAEFSRLDDPEHHEDPRGRATQDDDEEDDADDEEEPGVVPGPRVDASVMLARKPPPGYPSDLVQLAMEIDAPHLPSLIGRFLDEQTCLEQPLPPATLACPDLKRLRVFHSAVATFYAPSDFSGVGGMHKERIRSTPSWRGGPARRDCVFIETDASLPGMRGLHVARVRLLFSFKFAGIEFPCAFIEWFSAVSAQPDEDTGMWIVAPEQEYDGRRAAAVVHLDTVVRGAHLIGVAGQDYIPTGLTSSSSLDAFRAFYVNKYADHHSHEIAF